MRFDYFDMLSGRPIPFNGVGHIRSPQIKEVCPTSGIGYSNYNLYLNFLSWDKETFLKYDKLLHIRGADMLAAATTLTLFDVVTLLPQTRELCRETLSFFIAEDLDWDEQHRKYVASVTSDDGKRITGEITRENFEDLRKGILMLNYIGLEDDQAPINFQDDKAKAMWEKAQAFLKQQKKEAKDNSAYHIGNIVSKLCAIHPSYNLLNVFELTIFQLYDAFFQIAFLRATNLNERIFSNHGGDKFKFEDWMKPISKQV